MGEFSAERALEGSASARKSGSAPHPFALFFREFLRHPVMIGSIIPSSQRSCWSNMAPA
jgi:phospholipid N-methyltransferase